MSVQVLCPFFNWVFCFFHIELHVCLCVFWILIPFQISFSNNFSHSVSCLFILLVVSFLTPFQISFSNNFSHSVSCLFILLIVSSRHFPKEDKYMANSHMKRCSTSAIIRKIQSHKEIPPHIYQNCYHKKRTNNKCWQKCGQKKALVHCWWDCKLVQPLWKKVWWFFRKFKKNYPYNPEISL